MRKAVTLTLFALVLGAACLAVLGPLPGDVAVTLALQSAFGASPQWAEWLTDTAKPPLVIATMIFGAWLAWLAVGLRGALAVPLGFGFGWLIDKALRALIFAPRPMADGVEVASARSSSGLPSTFGLVFGAVFGVVLMDRAKRWDTALLKGVAAFLIILGAAARVVLGGHWPSQMIASILLGLAAAVAAHAATNLFRCLGRPNII